MNDEWVGGGWVVNGLVDTRSKFISLILVSAICPISVS